MSKGIKRLIHRVLECVELDIRGHANRGGAYSGALSGEGYNGGYRDALNDVQLALNGVQPNRQQWWSKEHQEYVRRRVKGGKS